MKFYICKGKTLLFVVRWILLNLQLASIRVKSENVTVLRWQMHSLVLILDHAASAAGPVFHATWQKWLALPMRKNDGKTFGDFFFFDFWIGIFYNGFGIRLGTENWVSHVRWIRSKPIRQHFPIFCERHSLVFFFCCVLCVDHIWILCIRLGAITNNSCLMWYDRAGGRFTCRSVEMENDLFRMRIQVLSVRLWHSSIDRLRIVFVRRVSLKAHTTLPLVWKYST